VGDGVLAVEVGEAVDGPGGAGGGAFGALAVALPGPRAQAALHDLRTLRYLHPRWNIAVAVQHSPDVVVVRVLDVEDEMGIAGEWPAPQAREIQLVGVAG